MNVFNCRKAEEMAGSAGTSPASPSRRAGALVSRRILIIVLASVLLCCSSINAQTMKDINPRVQPPMEIDQELVQANGLRVVDSQYITIYTDVPPSEPIDELPTIFDAAVPQWCEYFGVEIEKAKQWKIQAFLIRDKARFEKANLIPESLPEFPAGINRGHEIWFFVQPDDYYTRHLLLHEGTHAFMLWFGNGLGAPWYAEGMAELLGLHRWQDGKLTIHHQIKDPAESEGWGRPKLIKQWVAANADGKDDKTLQDVLLTPNRAFGEVESYAWAWAACQFLGEHPLTKDGFPGLQKDVHRQPGSFNRKFQKTFAKELRQVKHHWAMFVREMDYGYSISRAAISRLSKNDAGMFQLQVDRSWQYVVEEVKAGQQFRVTASGRFEIGSSQVNGQTKPWVSDSNGITIDYYRGRPIGELHAFVLPANDSAILPRLCKQDPIPIGAGNVITADIDGLLCFRINESPSNLSDNRGELKLAIEKVDQVRDNGESDSKHPNPKRKRGALVPR